MNIAYRTPLTVPEYLAWAEAQGERVRTELIDGQIVRMSPERVEHVELKLAVAFAFTMAVQASASQPLLHAVTEGLAVQVDDGTMFQPDALIYGGPKLPRGALVAPNPIVVAEVLSPTTAHIDRGIKLTGYFSLPSLQHYLIVDPDTMSVTHHARTMDGTVSGSTYSSGAIRLDPPGLTLDIDRILKG